MMRSFFLLAVFFLFNTIYFSQASVSVSLNWKLIDDNNQSVLIFKESSVKSPDKLPVYSYLVDVLNNEELSATLLIKKERLISSNELKSLNLKEKEFALEKPKVNITYTWERKDKKGIIHFVPLYKKQGQLILIESFDLAYKPKQTLNSFNVRSGSSFVNTSVLASGNFYKFGVSKNGVYKLTYEYLESKNVLSGTVNSNQLNLYGNHNGMLPEHNSVFRYDDLQKNAILIEDGGDGVFGQGDYILFYGQSPNKWKLNTSTSLFYFEKNLYTDTAFYFLIIDDNSGAKRIQNSLSSLSTVTHTVSSYNDFLVREIDRYNIMAENNRGGSGKKWYGDFFDVQLSYNYNFSFPNIDQISNVTVKTALLGFSSGSASASFSINIGGLASDNVVMPGISPGSHTALGIEKQSTLSFLPSANNIPVAITFAKASSPVSQGWLDYIEVNAKRKLKMYANQLVFRDVSTVGVGNVTQFNLTAANSIYKIWEVTDLFNITDLNFIDGGGVKSFVFESDSLREFIAFTNSNYLTPVFKGKVKNQNLHGQPVSDMIIVYHPLFEDEVNDLKSFHESKGLTVVKATVQQIYNEFSSGGQDITAIKTYTKMLYDKGGTSPPKYLLLFGDGSYDYKGRVNPNHNFVPVWESLASLNDLSSYVSDDFFAILDDGEGMGDYDLMDIAVGRFPVKSRGDARILVDKIKSYQKTGQSSSNASTCNTTASGNSFGDWRNKLIFVTDDVDDGWEMSFFNHAEKIADSVTKNFSVFNIQKYYMDSYKQETTPGGERYYDGAEALRRGAENGALILAYEGHGGEVGWAHERILDLATINGFTNYNRLPVFLTATCEFTKYDDPSRVSAGEQLILNPKGGTIALFTTSRAVFQSANERLIEAFYKETFIKKTDGSPRTLGEIYMKTKNHPLVSGLNNARRFGLIGDPALQLAFPKYKVITEKVNNVLVTGVIDTLNALSKVTIKGFVANELGAKLTNYNGFIFPTVYDKEKTFSTLGNYSPAYIAPFGIQNSVLYKGKATVTNGDFTFSFIVPKDINYQYGYGKISYYVFDGVEDGTGYFNKVIVGGTNSNVGVDNLGPNIKLYLNDKNFVSGGLTDEKPSLYAEIFDSNGINTTGNGIGHDITAIIDENTDKAIVLNNYYESDVNTYQSGKVTYPFSSLTEGNHTLTLKAWDVYNNSSAKTIDFVVVKNEKLAIDHVLNYPNPFTTRTQFFFEHNQTCESLEVQIQIYTVSGKLVKTLNKIVTTHGYRVDPVEWNGKDDFGDNIGRGTYVYRVKVIDNEGNKVEKFEKLVILK